MAFWMGFTIIWLRKIALSTSSERSEAGLFAFLAQQSNRDRCYLAHMQARIQGGGGGGGS